MLTTLLSGSDLGLEELSSTAFSEAIPDDHEGTLPQSAWTEDEKEALAGSSRSASEGEEEEEEG